ncbi:MAG TPA: ATP-dependent DNA ligase [Gaiellaceae bacterium]|nr:ATP-dependent DNA ligase [Gaiellaceae bacterium]
MPLRPARRPSQVARASLPSGVTAPIPVMATLLDSIILRRGAAPPGFPRPRASTLLARETRGAAQSRASRVSEAEPAPPGRLPFPPMEAELVDELPEGDGWQYEPKWDGFRGVLENLDGELHLWSRNGRPLLRYFPELAALGERLPSSSAVDGEIVIEREGGLDFDALQMRLHPAESRIRKLSAEMPAGFVAFDVLLWDGEDFHGRPLAERRAKVETLPFDVSPATRDLGEARVWLERLDVAGLDGVVAKRLDSAYLPGSREAVQKVKGVKTADCVVVGVTWSEKGTGIASLALGLYEDGELRPVGSAPAAGKRREEILERVEPLLGENPERRPRGEPSRWRPKVDLEWSPVPPELVVEVKYDKWQKGRFRHNARFLRFRPDKDPDQCTVDQVRPRPKKGDPTVPGLLGRAPAAPK